MQIVLESISLRNDKTGAIQVLSGSFTERDLNAGLIDIDRIKSIRGVVPLEEGSNEFTVLIGEKISDKKIIITN